MTRKKRSRSASAGVRRWIATWQQARNAARETIRWRFTVEKARKKMGRAYPTLPPAALPLGA